MNKSCPQIARSSGRDHHCAVVLPDICFAAWLCMVVYVEKAVRVYHLWPRSMGFWQLAAGKVVWCKGFTGRRKRQQEDKTRSSVQYFISSFDRSNMRGELVNVPFLQYPPFLHLQVSDIKHVWNVSIFCFSSYHANPASQCLGFMQQCHMEEIWFSSPGNFVENLKWSCGLSESVWNLNWTKASEQKVKIGLIYF